MVVKKLKNSRVCHGCSLEKGIKVYHDIKNFKVDTSSGKECISHNCIEWEEANSGSSKRTSEKIGDLGKKTKDPSKKIKEYHSDDIGLVTSVSVKGNPTGLNPFRDFSGYRTCKICSVPKKISEEYFIRTGGKVPRTCKDCERKKSLAHYYDHKHVKKTLFKEWDLSRVKLNFKEYSDRINRINSPQKRTIVKVKELIESRCNKIGLELTYSNGVNYVNNFRIPTTGNFYNTSIKVNIPNIYIDILTDSLIDVLKILVICNTRPDIKYYFIMVSEDKSLKLPTYHTQVKEVMDFVSSNDVPFGGWAKYSLERIKYIFDIFNDQFDIHGISSRFVF